MGSSNTDQNDDSATESDEATKTDTDNDTDAEKTESDEESPPSPGPSPYQENEKVLAFHCLHIYEAKVRKVEYQMKQWRFRVHYLGWNKSWDEWVGVDRLMKDTEANRHRQQAINKKQDAEKNLKQGRVSQMKPRSSNVGRGKKRKNDSLNKENSLPMENFLNIQIPPTLKKQLVDDCEVITHLGKLVKLPRTPNVDDILEKYRKYSLKKDRLIADSTGEIVKGLRCYFDKALPIMLLYKSERQQYEDAVAADVSPSTVYGAEHLLRLFVKLPELLVHAKIEEETLMVLQQKLVDFLKFLQKHQSAFFLASYDAAEDVETSSNKQED